MSAFAIEAVGVAKRFGRTWALRDCTVSIPTGRVVALVGPNGSGKSTLLRLVAGLTVPTDGAIHVLGETPGDNSTGLLGRIGYVDQDRPTYQGLRVGEMFRFGEGTNPRWDMEIARSYVDRLGISLSSRVSALSGGQQAQVALTMCLAKQAELLILDEPAAALDPVAREDLLRLLMGAVAESKSSVVISTHALSDVASVCDYLVILSTAKVVLADDLEFVLESHRFLTGGTSETLALPDGATVIDTRTSAREVVHLVRMELPITDDSWRITVPSLDEIILAYLRLGTASPSIDTSDASTISKGLR